MRNYTEPEISVVRFDMTDRITWEESGNETLPGTTYSENVELWD